MPALSTKDKLKLRLSAAKVERWNRERLKPAKNFTLTASGEQKPIERCKSVAWAHGQEKPTEEIGKDLHMDLHALTDGIRVRTMAGKLSLHGNAIAARMHTISHTDRETGATIVQVVHDLGDDSKALPNDPLSSYAKRETVKRRKDRVTRSPEYFAGLHAKVQVIKK